MKSQHIHDSLPSRRLFHSDQNAIWDEIDLKARRRGAVSDSMEMGRIYEKDVPHLDQYAKHFQPSENQIGAVFVINGEIAGMDSFGKLDTFCPIFKKLLNSYALDAIDWYADKKADATTGDINTFIELGCSAKIEFRDSVNLGIDCRFNTEKINGFSLAYDDQILHFAMFSRDDAINQRDSRMRRFSHRRGNRI